MQAIIGTTRVLVAVSVFFAACRNRPLVIADALSFAGPWQEYEIMECAPLVVVGRVISSEDDSSARRATFPDGSPLVLTRVRIALEAVLKGQAYLTSRGHTAGPDLHFGLWRYLIPPGRSFNPQRGDRRIFFLRAQKDIRLIGDAHDYSVPVYSGMPTAADFTGESAGYSIADVLLTPAPEASARTFAEYLDGSAATADYFSSRPYSRMLLRRLLSYSDAAVRGSACRVLVARYHESPGCFGTTRMLRNDAAATAAHAQERFRERFLSNPVAHLGIPFSTRRRIIDELVMLADSTDALIRKRARDCLHAEGITQF